jgi:predicted ATPase
VLSDERFVGRERQLATLRACLAAAIEGRGQVHFVTGQAGSGKTALVLHFLDEARRAHPDLVVASGNCNAQTGIGDPYLPFREALTGLTAESASGTATGGAARTVLVRAAQVLVDVAPDLVGLFVPGAKIAGTLGKTVAKRAGWLDKLDELAGGATTPALEQARVFEQFTAFIQRFSAESPLVLFIDDLHWADNASVGLLFHLARRIADRPVLLLGCYRPTDVVLGRDGARHPLEPVINELMRYHGDILTDLDEIPEADSRAFVDALVDIEENCLDDAFRAALYRHTGGHALFTVELLRSLRERGDLVLDERGCLAASPDLRWDLLPPRVEGVIEERIDRLEEALREMLTAASVEGQQFTAEVIARVQGIAEREAIRRLSRDLDRQHRLISAQGIARIHNRQLSLYRFAHSLFQQYLYGNLTEAERAYLHADVGAVLEALFSDATEEVAAQLARHFEEAGMPEKAVRYRLQAGHRALRLSAGDEAIAHLSRGLELLRTLPDGDERQQIEVELRTYLGRALIGAEGYSSPRVLDVLDRGWQLSRRVGDAQREFLILHGLCTYHLTRAELTRAGADARRLLELAETLGDEGLLLGAQQVTGAVAMFVGDYMRAREYLERVLATYDIDRHRDLGYYQDDPGVSAYSFLCLVLWNLGYAEQAVAAQEQAVALARALDRPYGEGFACNFSGSLRQMLWQVDACRAYGERTVEIGQWGPYPAWEAKGHIDRGWALAHQGQGDIGIAEMIYGLEMWRATGALVSMPYYRVRLAEAYLNNGRPQEGLAALEAIPDELEEIWWLPEQLRIHAELLLALADKDDAAKSDATSRAEELLRQALAEAERQGSLALSLRAATSLVRLLHHQGRDADVRARLAGIYRRFTEGHDTVDLREAREALEHT